MTQNSVIGSCNRRLLMQKQLDAKTVLLWDGGSKEVDVNSVKSVKSVCLGALAASSFLFRLLPAAQWHFYVSTKALRSAHVAKHMYVITVSPSTFMMYSGS